jgi:hypothetical protein
MHCLAQSNLFLSASLGGACPGGAKVCSTRAACDDNAHDSYTCVYSADFDLSLPYLTHFTTIHNSLFVFTCDAPGIQSTLYSSLSSSSSSPPATTAESPSTTSSV